MKSPEGLPAPKVGHLIGPSGATMKAGMGGGDGLMIFEDEAPYRYSD